MTTSTTSSAPQPTTTPSAPTLNGQRRPLGRAPGSRTRPRRTGLWFSLLLVLVVSVFASSWLWQHRSERLEALVIVTAVPVGTTIDTSDLAERSVAGVDGALTIRDLDQVVGRTAAVGLVPGQVLVPGMLTGTPVPVAGQRVVGLDLGAGRVAPTLAEGDLVRVLLVPADGEPGGDADLASPRVLTDRASVQYVGRSGAGTTRLGLVVPDADADGVAAFGAAGRVAVVEVPQGVSTTAVTGGER